MSSFFKKKMNNQYTKSVNKFRASEPAKVLCKVCVSSPVTPTTNYSFKNNNSLRKHYIRRHPTEMEAYQSQLIRKSQT